MNACTHGFASPLSCIACMNEGNIPPAPKPHHEWSHPFTARYDGYCRICGDDITQGDLIRLYVDDGGPVHDVCVNEATS